VGALGSTGRAPPLEGAIGVAIVLGLAVPALTLNTGQANPNSLGGNSPAAHALRDLERQGVPRAAVFPIQVLTHGGATGASQAAAIAARTEGLYAVLAPGEPPFRDGADSMLSVIPTAEGATAAGKATVTRLAQRSPAFPGASRWAATPRRTSTSATGLAFGIALDALVVRTLLVPALVALLGRWNWWMPVSLGRLLRLPEPGGRAVASTDQGEQGRERRSTPTSVIPAEVILIRVGTLPRSSSLRSTDSPLVSIPERSGSSKVSGRSELAIWTYTCFSARPSRTFQR
jgi:hypothetical protein